MRMKASVIVAGLAGGLAAGFRPAAAQQPPALPAPGFHHLHLDSMNPETAAAWYAKEFPSTSKTTWGGISVAGLDARVAKLRAENVTFLEQPHRVGDTRAVLIEGPGREALELIEVK
jgi:hypothetical protein